MIPLCVRSTHLYVYSTTTLHKTPRILCFAVLPSFIARARSFLYPWHIGIILLSTYVLCYYAAFRFYVCERQSSSVELA